MPDNLTRYRIVAIAVAGRQAVRQGRERDHRAAAADGAAEPAAVPELRRHVQAAGRRPEPDRRADDGEARGARDERDAHRRRGPRGHRAGRTIASRCSSRPPPSWRAPRGSRSSAPPAATSDAAELALPVWTPATTEAFATYGVIDDGAITQPVALPGKVVTQFGGLEVTTASTNLQALTDAMLYLVHYPFECAEQRASRVLGDRGAARRARRRSRPRTCRRAAAMEAQRRRRHRAPVADAELRRRLRVLGARLRAVEPYLTRLRRERARRARRRRATRSRSDMLERAKHYLQRHRAALPAGTTRTRSAARSSRYALYTRKQMGDLDIAKGAEAARARPAASTSCTMEANGWLLGTFAGNAGRGDRAQGDRAPRAEQGQRDRRRRELHDRLRRRRVPAARESIAASTA